jgi:hypothetical protein
VAPTQRDQAGERAERRVDLIGRVKFVLRNAAVLQDLSPDVDVASVRRTQFAGQKARGCVGKDLRGSGRNRAASEDGVDRPQTVVDLEAHAHPRVEGMVAWVEGVR